MADIRWERDLYVAIQQAISSKRPLFLDFWFDG
ncbi:hypothetical protein OR1_01631 [Geobacter sp. OR-1]|nr:hypothetical protein OR1_01631 [Geobacter sp. OR-1]